MRTDEARDSAVAIIREEIAREGVAVTGVILFGSRARGQERPGSDWDFLVSVKEEMSFPRKAGITARVQTRLAERGIDADLVIKTEERIRLERDNVGVITHYALKNGVLV